MPTARSSVDPAATAPPVLVVHDGELTDMCALLSQLGVHVCDRPGGHRPEDEEADYGLIVATPGRMLSVRGRRDRKQQPTRMAVLDRAGRTGPAMLRRMGVDLLVRRPVHPEALRLLLLHTLYRGPERRRTRRVSVGAPVRFRTALRRRAAVLAELSIRGCRLLSSEPAGKEKTIKLTLPGELAGGSPLSIRGRVRRVGPKAGTPVERSACSMIVVFEGLKPAARKRLAAIVEAFAAGPAVLERVYSAHSEPAPARARPTQRAEPEPAGADTPRSDRRAHPRRTLDRQVTMLGDRASRVLLGRDISRGGMRIEPNPELAIGEELRIALHLQDRTEPLVVSARVERDDGDAGLLLRFRELDGAGGAQLEKLIEDLPVASAFRGDEAPVVVSEILESRAS